MIISGWRLEGYGVFADYLVEGLGPGLTVLHGPNEAGKTTLLDFLRFMLFGQSRSDPKHEPLAGGRHGGYLYLLDENRAQWTVERQASPSARLAVAGPGGRRGTEQDIIRLDGGVDAVSFRNVFAFSLGELSRFETLSANEVKQRIFSAGISGAGDDAGEARSKLNEQASTLLRPRSGLINDLALQLSETRRQLDRARAEAEAYPAAVTRQEQAGEQVERLAVTVQQLEEHPRRLEALLGLWEPYNLWAAAQHELDASPDYSIGPQTVRAMQDLRVEIRVTCQHREEYVAQTVQLERERASLNELPDLAALAGDAGRVASQLALQRERLSRRDTLQADIAGLHRELGQLLGRLGLDELQGFTASSESGGAGADGRAGLALPVTVSDELLGWERELGEARRRFQSAADRAGDAARQARLARQHAEALRRELQPVLAGPALEEVLAQRDRLDSIERTDARLARSRARRMAWLAAGVALIAAAVGLSLAGHSSWAWPLGSAGLASALAGLFFAGRAAGAEARALRDLAVEAGLGATPDQPAIEEARHGLRDAEVLARDRADALVRARTAGEELARAEAEAAELSAASGAAAEAKSRLQVQWQEWKAERAFPQDLSADGVRDYIALFGQAQQVAASIAKARAELSRTREDIVAWEEAARGVLQEGAAAQPGLVELTSFAAELPDAIAVLKEAAGSALETQRKARELSERLSEAGAQLAACQAKLAGLDSDHRGLLGRAGARDDDDFDRRVAETEARNKLHAEVAERRAAVEARLGHGEYAERLRAALESGDPESWQAELDHVREDLTLARRNHTQAIEDRRDAQLAREALEVSADIPRLAAHEASLVSEINRAVSEWRTVRVAQILVEQALEAYVRERQPEVLQVASRVFSRITGGRYGAVLQETTGEGLAVLDARGLRKSPAELSRGTVEQLYLAMRLGLAESIARRSTPLPLVMDDVLVNFDPGRARRLVESLVEYLGSGDRQILLFTCHPQTRDLVSEVAPNSSVIEIGWTIPAARTEVAASTPPASPERATGSERPAAKRRGARKQP